MCVYDATSPPVYDVPAFHKRAGERNWLVGEWEVASYLRRYVEHFWRERQSFDPEPGC